ncbi:HYC_CC_PP family protein [Flavobacterium sp. RSB2_4_14]|uniref:HYC_CC_PP family protein n=1 Tax=Flavobacterium sp. RSB2_4_14 TaxID=3447665 RepID=UPI003F3069B1
MKKHISFLIALLVLVSNSGLAFSVHYCGGKIAAVSSVFSQEEVCQMPIKVEKTCCAKQETANKGCCSDKKINLKSKAEQVIIKTISLDFEPVYFSDYRNQLFAEIETQHFSNEKVAFYCQSNAPPLYKLYCQYTFYS